MNSLPVPLFQDGDLAIYDLGDVPEAIPAIAKWLHKEWAQASYSLQDIVLRTQRCLNKDKLPRTLVALYKGLPAGTVSLWHNDLRIRPDLSPYLVALYIRKRMRGQGLGKALLAAAEKAAVDLGYPSLYLITDMVDYYEKAGWEFLSYEPMGSGRKTRLYKCNLTQKYA